MSDNLNLAFLDDEHAVALVTLSYNELAILILFAQRTFAHASLLVVWP